MRLLLSLLCAAFVLVAAPAALASGRDVIKDCAEDGVIDGDYSEREYKEAQDELPSDIDEYTDCREAIRGGLTPGGRGRAGSTEGADPALVTESGAVAGSRDDIRALDAIEEAAHDGDAPALNVGGESVTPGDPSSGKLLGLAGTGNELPAPMIPVLVLLLLSAGAGLYPLLRRRLPAVALPDLKGARAALARLFRR